MTNNQEEQKLRRICEVLFWTIPLLMWDGIRLFGLVLCLIPGFVRFVWYYCVASKRTSIQFDNQSCRQTLDVYQLLFDVVRQDEENSENKNSTNTTKGAPVVIFYTGGAWLIGYKMWGTLLARALNPCGIVVVIPDMRNYPWGTVPLMVQDVNTSIQWTFDNISQYGGDPTKIIVVGQSAGGNVACVSILQKAIQHLQDQQQEIKNKISISDNNDLLQSSPPPPPPPPPTPPTPTPTPTTTTTTNCSSNNNNEEGLNTPLLSSNTVVQQQRKQTSSSSSSTWQPTDIKGFVSLSAPYCLDAMKTSLRKHGLNKHIVDDCIFDGQRSKYDPMILIRQLQQQIIIIRQQQQQQQQQFDDNQNQDLKISSTNSIDTSLLASPSSSATLSSQKTIHWSTILPSKIKIYHGDKDKTVPCSGSMSFYQELCKVATATTSSNLSPLSSSSLNENNISTHGQQQQQQQSVEVVDCHIYENWTHTDPILEGPMDADHRFHKDLFYLIKDWTTTKTSTTTENSSSSSSSSKTTTTSTTTLKKEWPENNPLISDRLCPHFLVEGARFCNPF